MPNENTAPTNDSAVNQTANTAETKVSADPIRVGGKEYGNWEEVGKAYESLQSEHGKWTNQYGQLKNQYEEASKLADQAKRWNEWWKDIQPLWGEDVEDFLRKKMSGGGKQGQQAAQQLANMQAQQGQEAWDGWELLQPREQAQRMQQYLANNLQSQYDGRLAELAKAVQDTLNQKEQWYSQYLNNHLGLLRKAFEKKLQDPNFDIDKTMAAAAQAMSGQYDPIALGQQLIDAQGFQSQLEAAKKAAYEQAKQDFELAAKNKQEEPAPLSVGGAPKFKFPTTNGSNTRNGLLGYREKAAEQIYKNFGPQWFGPER